MTTLLEAPTRLSRSLLWQMQRRYYEEHGPEAFSRLGVPHYITTNPTIAGHYAQVVLGFLRDLPGAGSAPGALDPGQPLYIVELGAGAGRFAYHFLRRFGALHAASPLRDQPVCYVLSDLSERNLAAWGAHPSLQPFLGATGRLRLDMARFDLERDGAFHLLRSGEVLRPGALRNPLVVLANYIFDSTRQDAFVVRDGRLFEVLVTLRSAAPAAPDPEDPALLAGLEVGHEERPVQGGYYGEAGWDAILEGYLQLPQACLLFPVSAFACVERLAQLAAGRLLLLAGDKGFTKKESLIGLRPPGLSFHGSFSFWVNFHALATMVQARGGVALCQEHTARSLAVCAFLLGEHATGYAETRLAFAEVIGRNGPDDFFTLKKILDGGDGGGAPRGRAADMLAPDQVLAVLRLFAFDPDLFTRLAPALLAAPPAPALRGDLLQALDRVAEAWYPIPGADADALPRLLAQVRAHLEGRDGGSAGPGPRPALPGHRLAHIGITPASVPRR